MTDKLFYPFEPQPLMVVISGPSGVGKDAVIQRMKERSVPFHFVVTATTRPRREKEVHGVDYFFVTKDEFAEMINTGQMLEYAIVYNDYKGIPREQVEQALGSNKDVVLRVDVQGAATIHEKFPDALLIFLTVEDEKDLEQRLTSRKSEQRDELKLRIATARQELKRINEFDYVVVNRQHQLEETVDLIMAIIQAEHHRVEQRKVEM